MSGKQIKQPFIEKQNRTASADTAKVTDAGSVRHGLNALRVAADAVFDFGE